MATAWRSKWLDWTPEQRENISETPLTEVPKVPKVPPLATVVLPETTFGTFGTDSQRASENISDPSVAEWDAVFAEWTAKRCRWRERSYGSVSRLYIDCCEWSTAHGYPLVPDLGTFETILTCLGIRIEDGFAYGLLMREDACLADSDAAIPLADALKRPLRGDANETGLADADTSFPHGWNVAPASDGAKRLDTRYVLPKRGKEKLCQSL
jgi:hypothetical protein